MKLNPQQAPLYVSTIVHAPCTSPCPFPRSLFCFWGVWLVARSFSLVLANILCLDVQWMETF